MVLVLKKGLVDITGRLSGAEIGNKQQQISVKPHRLCINPLCCAGDLSVKEINLRDIAWGHVMFLGQQTAHETGTRRSPINAERRCR